MWWDLTKIINWIYNLNTRKTPSVLYQAFSFHWMILSQDPRSTLICWPKSRSLSFADVFESWKLCYISHILDSCDLLAKVKVTSVFDVDYEAYPVSMGYAWLVSLGLLCQSQGLNDSEEIVRSDIRCTRPGSRPNGSRNWIGSNWFEKPT